MIEATEPIKATEYAALYNGKIRKFGVFGAAIVPDALVITRLAEVSLQRAKIRYDTHVVTDQASRATSQERTSSDIDKQTGWLHWVLRNVTSTIEQEFSVKERTDTQRTVESATLRFKERTSSPSSVERETLCSLDRPSESLEKARVKARTISVSTQSTVESEALCSLHGSDSAKTNVKKKTRTPSSVESEALSSLHRSSGSEPESLSNSETSGVKEKVKSDELMRSLIVISREEILSQRNMIVTTALPSELADMCAMNTAQIKRESQKLSSSKPHSSVTHKITKLERPDPEDQQTKNEPIMGGTGDAWDGKECARVSDVCGVVHTGVPRAVQHLQVPTVVGFQQVPLYRKGLYSNSLAGAKDAVIHVLLGVQPLMQLLVTLPPQCQNLRPTLEDLRSMVEYLHQPAAQASGSWDTGLLRTTVEVFRKECTHTDLTEPANFLKFVLQKLCKETAWGPEEFPFRDQVASMHSSYIEGSAMRNIFGGTRLWYNGDDKSWQLQPFEILQIDLPAHGTLSLNALAMHCVGPFNGICGAPPVLIVELQRCTMHGVRERCHVNYGLALTVPTKSPEGVTAYVPYEFMAGVFRVPNDEEGRPDAVVQYGQQWWWFRDAVVQRIHHLDVISREMEIRLAIYARRDCSSINVQPPRKNHREFWLAKSKESGDIPAPLHASSSTTFQ